jgi:uncharacterized protein YtpQ (UPF0354 family)
MARMNVHHHIQGLRNRYVEALRRAIAKAKADGTFLASEVVIRAEGGVAGGTSNDESAVPTNQPTFLTVDLLTGTPEAPQPAILMRDPEEGPLLGAVQQGTIEVAVYPFLWEACRVWLRHPEPDWTPLEAWFRKWFEERLEAEPGEDGLKLMVHLLSDPIAEGGGHLFQVDFGSAPVEAFTDLLQALSDMGATEVRVGHSDGSDMDPSVVDALRSPDLTPERFVGIVAQLVRELEGVNAVTVADASQMVLRIEEEGLKEPSVSNLGNLWLVLQRTTPEHRPREVARYLRGQLESSQYRKLNDKPDLATLRPVIKPTAFVENVRHLAEQKGDGRLALLCTRLVGDLWIACVWDRPNGMQFVTASEPEEFGLSSEEAYARALRNYLAARGPVETTRTDRGVIVARTHDNYDASLLLDDAFWVDMAAKLPGMLLACAPTRDAVLITSVETPGGEAALRTTAREYLQAGNHAISTTVLKRQFNTWQVLQADERQTPVVLEEPAPPPPPAAPKGGEESPPASPKSPRRKPWWKFW